MRKILVNHLVRVETTIWSIYQFNNATSNEHSSNSVIFHSSVIQTKFLHISIVIKRGQKKIRNHVNLAKCKVHRKKIIRRIKPKFDPRVSSNRWTAPRRMVGIVTFVVFGGKEGKMSITARSISRVKSAYIFKLNLLLSYWKLSIVHSECGHVSS